MAWKVYIKKAEGGEQWILEDLRRIPGFYSGPLAVVAAVEVDACAIGVYTPNVALPTVLQQHFVFTVGTHFMNNMALP